MNFKKHASIVIAGMGAGIVNGLFGAGGGMVLVPLLSRTNLEEKEIFPASVCIILPICIVSLLFTAHSDDILTGNTFTYLIGSAAGGILAGVFGKRIPTLWLHRLLGILILWGGIRYLC